MNKSITVLITLFSLLFFSNGKSQSLKRTELPDHSPYVGKWIGTTGSDSLIVNLILKDFYFEPIDRSFKILYGTYEYFTESNIDREVKRDFEFPLKQGIIQERGDKKFISFIFNDEVLIKTGQLRLYINEDNKDMLEWHLSQGELNALNPSKAIRNSHNKFSVPNEMILVRAN